MLWTVLAWAAFALLLWYAWSGIAIIAAAPRENLTMLWIVGAWQLVSAIAAFIVWRASLTEILSPGAIVALAIAASNPFLWKIGFIGNRLRSHGVRLNNVLMFR